MEVFVNPKVLLVAMFVTMMTGILLMIYLGLMIGHMIRESDKMTTTDNKQLKLCKTKFSGCYEMNNGVSNVSIFVDKFLSRMKWGLLPCNVIYHLSGQMMLSSVILSGICACLEIVSGKTVGQILPLYIVSFAGLYIYFSVSGVADIKNKINILKINLVDYLENQYIPRMYATRQNMDILNGSSKASEGKIRKEAGIYSISGCNNESSQEKKNFAMTAEQPADNECAVTAEELEALLQEFLTG